MDWIIPVIIILIFSSIFSDKKKKKRQQDVAAKQPQKPAKAVNFKDMDALPNTMSRPAVQKPAPKPIQKPAPGPSASKPEPAKPVFPKSGSLNFSGLEGEAPEEHAEHNARAAAAEQLQHEAAEAAQSAYEINLEQLQNAVIMSEILNRPVSLRRNGCRG